MLYYYVMFYLFKKKRHYFIDFAEILGKKEVNGKHVYYIHYEDCEYIVIVT